MMLRPRSRKLQNLLSSILKIECVLQIFMAEHYDPGFAHTRNDVGGWKMRDYWIVYSSNLSPANHPSPIKGITQKFLRNQPINSTWLPRHSLIGQLKKTILFRRDEKVLAGFKAKTNQKDWIRKTMHRGITQFYGHEKPSQKRTICTIRQLRWSSSS